MRCVEESRVPGAIFTDSCPRGANGSGETATALLFSEVRFGGLSRRIGGGIVEPLDARGCRLVGAVLLVGSSRLPGRDGARV